MASGGSASLIHHPYGSAAGTIAEASPNNSTPPPSGLLIDPSVNLLGHHLVMKNELHHSHHHRLYQPYNHLSLHHHHLAQQQQQQHDNGQHLYDMGHHHYSAIASTSGSSGLLGGVTNASIVPSGADSRCSSVSSSGGTDHNQLSLKSEQQQNGSLESSSLELLDGANVSNCSTTIFIPRETLLQSATRKL